MGIRRSTSRRSPRRWARRAMMSTPASFADRSARTNSGSVSSFGENRSARRRTRIRSAAASPRAASSARCDTCLVPRAVGASGNTARRPRSSEQVFTSSQQRPGFWRRKSNRDSRQRASARTDRNRANSGRMRTRRASATARFERRVSRHTHSPPFQTARASYRVERCSPSAGTTRRRAPGSRSSPRRLEFARYASTVLRPTVARIRKRFGRSTKRASIHDALIPRRSSLGACGRGAGPRSRTRPSGGIPVSGSRGWTRPTRCPRCPGGPTAGRPRTSRGISPR